MSDVNHHYTKTLYRHGAAAARGAHNPEDTRSKRVAGIIHHLLPVFQDTKHNHQTILKTNSQAQRLINRVGMDSL